MAVVEAPKQEGRSPNAHHRLMAVTTPPFTTPAKQTKVPMGRNEGTILQDRVGKKVLYCRMIKVRPATPPVTSRLTTQLGFWTILYPPEKVWTRGLQEMRMNKANKERRRRDL
jgi:hypothetical protein